MSGGRGLDARSSYLPEHPDVIGRVVIPYLQVRLAHHLGRKGAGHSGRERRGGERGEACDYAAAVTDRVQLRHFQTILQLPHSATLRQDLFALSAPAAWEAANDFVLHLLGELGKFLLREQVSGNNPRLIFLHTCAASASAMFADTASYSRLQQDRLRSKIRVTFSSWYVKTNVGYLFFVTCHDHVRQHETSACRPSLSSISLKSSLKSTTLSK